VAKVAGIRSGPCEARHIGGQRRRGGPLAARYDAMKFDYFDDGGLEGHTYLEEDVPVG
jgi:hypothetical protein